MALPSHLARSAPVLALSAAFSTVVLCSEPSGTDLAAAVARGDFAREHPLTPIDLRWYGGTNQFGYSLIAQHAVALLGARPVGVLSALCSSLLLLVLLGRYEVSRPVGGASIACCFFFGNLVSGRTAWALGMALGLLALVSLGRDRRWPPVLLAVLAGAASPVAGLFLGLSGTALVLSGRRRDGSSLIAGSAMTLALCGALFGEGGWMHFGPAELRPAVALSVAVLVLVPYRPVRWGAALALVGVCAAFLLPTPVGMNATRLVMVFGVPLVVATVRGPKRLVTALALALLQLFPPLAGGDWRQRGDVAAEAAYYAPLLAELERRAPTGRIEVPQLSQYWDSVFVARQHLLARGWLRQADTARHPLFFDGMLDAGTYRSWLVDNGVQYVAVASASGSWVGAAERDLVLRGEPYLELVWRSATWQLFQVQDSTGLVDDGAVLRAAGSASLDLEVQEAETLVRVRHSRWLTVDGPGDACLRPDEDGWTTLVTTAPGRYRISSSLLASNGCP